MQINEKQALLAKWSLEGLISIQSITSRSIDKAMDEMPIKSRKTVKTIKERAIKLSMSVISYYSKGKIFSMMNRKYRNNFTVNFGSKFSKKQLINYIKNRMIEPNTIQTLQYFQFR